MIITRLTGGLGNQMFQYAIGRSLALKYKTKLKIDTSFYARQELRKYELGDLNIEENIASENECRKLRGAENSTYRFIRKVNHTFGRPDNYCEEKKNYEFDSTLYQKRNDLYLSGHWLNEKYFVGIRNILLKEFTPKYPISGSSLDLLSEIKNSESVSIHVRRGDYVQNEHTNKHHGTCSLEYYKTAVEYLNQRGQLKIFFFSDDIDWCKANFSSYKNESFFIDQTKSVVEDMILMKFCKYNIIANSTFSWWGAWLNENREKVIISPKIWFKSNHNSHIAPKHWLRF